MASPSVAIGSGVPVRKELSHDGHGAACARPSRRSGTPRAIPFRRFRADGTVGLVDDTDRPEPARPDRVDVGGIRPVTIPALAIGAGAIHAAAVVPTPTIGCWRTSSSSSRSQLATGVAPLARPSRGG
jgi:hypothetical protein